jgi:hypothetical protein
VHILHFSFFFQTMTTFASHVGYWTSLIKPATNSLWTSALAGAIFLFEILRSFYFFGFVEGLMWRLCSIILLLTPMRSEDFQEKTSLFLSKNESNFVSSSDVRSWTIIIVLSGTLRSKGTLFVSHSGSITILPSVWALALGVQISCWSPSSASRR